MENSILYSEINIVCILMLGLLSEKVKKSVFLQAERQLLYLEIVANIVFLTLDAVWIFVDANQLGVTVAANWALNIAYYIVSGLLGYFWFCYSETVQQSGFVTNSLYRRLAAAPAVLLTVLTITSVKTHWLFYIGADNSYHRGPLYALQLLLSYGYVIFTAGKAFHDSIRTDDYGRRSDMRVLASFVVPTLLAGTAQVVFPGYPILCIGNTFGILYVYITRQEHLVSIDALTRLNNRNQLHRFLSGKVSHPSDKHDLYLLLMDVDYFKQINDGYGHPEGDRALRTLANCLKRVASDKHYFIARYGGDEFVMICELKHGEPVAAVCEAIHAELKTVDAPYKLSVSIGCAQLTPSVKTQQELISRADKELYKVKKSRR